VSDCLFCGIVEGSVPATKVYESDTVVGFEDIAPAAPTHVLVVPREHVESARELAQEHGPVLADLFVAAAQIVAERGLEDYRVVTNIGPDAGQSVYHLHLHVLAGRRFGWPPG